MKTNKYGFESIKIASPCKADWNEMTGDDRARFCSLCQQHVYNFSSLTGHEIAELIKEREGKRTCVRFYRRKDGTIMTKDCPVGFQQRRRRAIGTLAAMAFGSLGWWAVGQTQEHPPEIMGEMIMGDMLIPSDAEPVQNQDQIQD